MKNELIHHICKVVVPLGIDQNKVNIDYTELSIHGDFTTNIAMASARELKLNPKVLAQNIVDALHKSLPKFVEKVDIAGPGFINFKIKDSFIAELIAHKELDKKENKEIKKEKVLVEFTDPNTFKVFHIGHIMSNSIGESIARLITYGGDEVIRICYPSDIGLHISKSIWAMKNYEMEIPNEISPIEERTAFLGKMYVEGTKAYDADPKAKTEIDDLNKVMYEKSDKELHKLFETGRRWSLKHFDILYERLGTKFDETIYESDMAPIGLDIVKKNIGTVFSESEGAIVWRGEDHGLHTRVFINSKGLPTYESKELGLNITKFMRYPDAKKSIVITASEQNDYFKVLSKVISIVDPKDGSKLKHIGHGMMRFANGKMSSRTGEVVTAEALLGDIKAMVMNKIIDRNFLSDEANDIAEAVSVAAIKYTILRSSTGSDIIFDSAASISFEGDSGPYLQYSAVRANSLLLKAEAEGFVLNKKIKHIPEQVGELERQLVRFDDIAKRAGQEFAPQQVASYLTNLAGEFNSFYNNTKVLDKDDKLTDYRLALVQTFFETMTKGLYLLGIKVPKKM